MVLFLSCIKNAKFIKLRYKGTQVKSNLPSALQGRQVVAIANDITFQSGAFGPREDALFKAATELALEERLPMVYLAANSGAAAWQAGALAAHVIATASRITASVFHLLLRCLFLWPLVGGLRGAEAVPAAELNWITL